MKAHLLAGRSTDSIPSASDVIPDRHHWHTGHHAPPCLLDPAIYS
jgi:hypothetical protein